MDPLQHQDGSPYINEIEFQPPSPSSVPLDLSPHQTPYDTFDFGNALGTPPFERSPSFNGSYHSPYSGHSELSFVGDEPSFGLFDDAPVGLNIPDYNPSDYDPPNTSSLLMFNDNDYMSGYDNQQISVSVVGPSDQRVSYDYSSPSSNGGGESGGEGGMRSRGSSVSSNPQISPSPRMDVARDFENMAFNSPNWGSAPLPNANRMVDPSKPQSPPRLLMPETHTPAYQTPNINAPDGDGGLMGPKFNIVPATPVSGGGATHQAVPFQTTLETLPQGESMFLVRGKFPRSFSVKF